MALRIRQRKGTVLPFMLRMKIHNQELITLPVEQLHTHPQNPRRGDIMAIAESIVHNGFYGAVVVQKTTNFILVGNHRYEAAKSTGAEKIPALVIDVTDEDAMRIMLADNRTAELGGFDEAQLAGLLQELTETSLGLSGTGYRQEDLDNLGVTTQEQDQAQADVLPLAESGKRDVYETLSVLRWGKYVVTLTEPETLGLTKLYHEHVERTGVEFGFVADMLERLGCS